MNQFGRFLPFLRWFSLRGGYVKTDLIASLTFALAPIPQSMAYAQFAIGPVASLLAGTDKLERGKCCLVR